MSQTVVQHAVNDVASLGQASIAVTVSLTGLGNLIVVACGGGGTTDVVSSVTDNAVGGSSTYTAVPSSFTSDSSNGAYGKMYACVSSRVGATTVTVNFSPNGDFPYIEVWEVSGFTTPAVDQVAVTNNGSTSATPLGPAVTPTGTAFIAAQCVVAHSVTVSPKAGNEFTSGGDIGSHTGPGFCSLANASVASHQPQWDQSSSGTFCATTASFKETASARGLFRTSMNPAGVGIGGAFFRDPLQAATRASVGRMVRKNRIFVPERYAA